MYEQLGLQDLFYLMLYGAVTMLALVACLYLLLRRCNMFSSTINSPKELRQWTATFLGAVTMSHVWWTTQGTVWLTDHQNIRNAVCELLDFSTLLPLVMVFLLRMLQDRLRPVWPMFVSAVPAVVVTVVCLMVGCESWETFVVIYELVVITVFLVYYVRALRQYSHWLRDNYADLEHKEVWRSLVALACIMVVFMVYVTNTGGIVIEYATQIASIVMIIFLVWRVETLQQLEVDAKHYAEEPTDLSVQNQASAMSIPINIGELLEKECVNTELYLQHDLTLAQLAAAIGTNRTYLGAWFSQQGITYNAYINSLRVNHFCRLYHDATAGTTSTAQPANVKAQSMAIASGFLSYSTFSAAFKKIMGQTVTAWMRSEAS